VTAAVLTPFTGSAATELGNHRWLKRLLPVGEISYQGRVLKFTRDYLSGLVDAFHSRAYDQVPFQLAGDSNKHTNDVERFGGKITDMSLRNDGLYIELDPTERGERVLRDNPDCGVSARIVESYERSDGQFYPKAIQHVLATLDPRIPALGGWQAVDAANDVDITFDLSTASFTTEETAMPELTDEQHGKLAELLKIPADKLAKLVAGLTADDVSGLTGGDVGGGGSENELSDEELDALIDEALALEAAGLLGDGEPEPEREPAGAGAGLANDQLALELAQAGVDENTRQLGIITAQLDNERWLNERAKLISRGVPPYIADLAQPLLEGSAHTVELSGGKFVDAGQIVRKVLDEYTKIGEQLGLGVELGTTMDVPDDINDDARDLVLKRAKRDMGLIR
jgi:hypothetical protein